MKVYNYVIVLVSLLSTPVFACVGPEQKFDIEFEKVSGNGDVAVKRKINGQVKEEILDDTGYVGAMLAMVELENHPTVAIPINDPRIQFLKERLEKLAVSIESYDTEKVTIPLVEAIRKSLDKAPIAKIALVAKWKELDTEFHSKKYNFTAKTRPANGGQWSAKEEPLQSFVFPSNAKARSDACGSSIQSFKTNGGPINKNKIPPPLFLPEPAKR